MLVDFTGDGATPSEFLRVRLYGMLRSEEFRDRRATFKVRNRKSRVKVRNLLRFLKLEARVGKPVEAAPGGHRIKCNAARRCIVAIAANINTRRRPLWRSLISNTCATPSRRHGNR